MCIRDRGDAAGFAASTWMRAVSYTHLDVYKRQGSKRRTPGQELEPPPRNRRPQPRNGKERARPQHEPCLLYTSRHKARESNSIN